MARSRVMDTLAAGRPKIPAGSRSRFDGDHGTPHKISAADCIGSVASGGRVKLCRRPASMVRVDMPQGIPRERRVLDRSVGFAWAMGMPHNDPRPVVLRTRRIAGASWPSSDRRWVWRSAITQAAVSKVRGILIDTRASGWRLPVAECPMRLVSKVGWHATLRGAWLPRIRRAPSDSQCIPPRRRPKKFADLVDCSRACASAWLLREGLRA